MVEGAWLIIGITAIVVFSCIAFCYWLDRTAKNQLNEFDEWLKSTPGDATDTTEMRSNVRRVNHKGRA